MRSASPLRPDPLASALAGLRPGLWLAGAVSAAIGVLMLTGSVYMLQVYDRVLASGSVPTLVVLFGLVVVLYGFLAFYDGLRMRLLARLSLRLDADLGGRAFAADLAAGTGGQALRDLATLRATLAGPAALALFDLPFTLLFLGTLFLLHPLFGWLTLGGMAVAAGLALANRRVTAGPLAAAQEAEAGERLLAEQARRAASAIAALGMAGAVAARWRALHGRALAAGQRSSEPSEALAALSRSFRMLLQSGLLTAGAWLVIRGAVSPGAIVASSILAGRALAPVDQLIGQWQGVARAAAAGRRLGPALAAAERPAAALALPAPTGRIAVTGLTRFAPARPGRTAERRRLLDAISFTLEPGAGLGIVGASASGKSTLARLLVGALEPDGGEIRFDGATPEQWDRDVLGAHVGYLPQQLDLLPGTLRDNIARFDPEASDAAVIAAAEAAGVHEMILGLPDGYGTDLARGEVPLSGGQVQRIGLARALYGRPRILVLDEPNAHLDIAGEAALTRALRELRAGGTTVIVMAHRASALAAVDRVMVLEAGRIVQDGPRDAILGELGAQARQAPPAAGALLPEGGPVTALRFSHGRSPGGITLSAAAAGPAGGGLPAAAAPVPAAPPAPREAAIAAPAARPVALFRTAARSLP